VLVSLSWVIHSCWDGSIGNVHRNLWFSVLLLDVSDSSTSTTCGLLIYRGKVGPSEFPLSNSKGLNWKGLNWIQPVVVHFPFSLYLFSSMTSSLAISIAFTRHIHYVVRNLLVLAFICIFAVDMLPLPPISPRCRKWRRRLRWMVVTEGGLIYEFNHCWLVSGFIVRAITLEWRVSWDFLFTLSYFY